MFYSFCRMWKLEGIRTLTSPQLWSTVWRAAVQIQTPVLQVLAPNILNVKYLGTPTSVIVILVTLEIAVLTCAILTHARVTQVVWKIGHKSMGTAVTATHLCSVGIIVRNKWCNHVLLSGGGTQYVGLVSVMLITALTRIVTKRLESVAARTTTTSP